MSFLTDTFTADQLEPVLNGIRTFIRLQGLIYDPNPLVWGKWLADEQDLKAQLNTVADSFAATRSMLGKRKYQNVDFDAPQSVARDLFVYLTTDHKGIESATLRKRNLSMYHLVIHPTIQLFYQFDHLWMIENAHRVVNGVIEVLDGCTDYGNYEQAQQAQLEVAALVREREQQRKALIEAKRPRKRRDPLLDMLEAYNTDRDEDDFSEPDMLDELYT